MLAVRRSARAGPSPAWADRMAAFSGSMTSGLLNWSMTVVTPKVAANWVQPGNRCT